MKKKIDSLDGFELALLACLVVVILGICLLINGALVLLAWHVFHLMDLVAINYSQAIGIAFILTLFTFPTRTK